MWVGEEFPRTTMTNNGELTIIGCMRQWWIVYFKPIEDNQNGYFLPSGMHWRNGDWKKIPLEVLYTVFPVFPHVVINKKKYRCSDSLCSRMTVFHPFIGLLLFFLLCCCFLNSPVHAVLGSFEISFFLVPSFYGSLFLLPTSSPLPPSFLLLFLRSYFLRLLGEERQAEIMSQNQEEQQEIEGLSRKEPSSLCLHTDALSPLLHSYERGISRNRSAWRFNNFSTTRLVIEHENSSEVCLESQLHFWEVGGPV